MEATTDPPRASAPDALARAASLFSFRARLATFALICAVPLLALTGLQLRSDTARIEAAAVGTAIGLAGAMKERVEQDLVNAELVARALGAMVRPGAAPRCEPTLGSVVAAAGPRVTNIILVSAAGDVLCSARPLPQPTLNVADRPHMRRALALRAPVVSGFVIGRVSGQGNLQMAVPILDEGGRVSAFVVVGLTAGNLLSTVATDAPARPTLVLFDSEGVLVSRSPESRAVQSGQQLAASELFRKREEAVQHPIVLEWADGVRRLTTASPVRFGEETAGWIASGAELSLLRKGARDALRRDLAIVLLLTIAVVALALVVSRPLVLGRYRALLGVATRVTAGDHRSRVPVTVADDLTPVETAVNRMLDAIEHDRSELAERESRYRLLFENNLDGVLETSPDGTVIRGNPAASALLGRAPSELAGVRREELVDVTDPRLPQLLAERNATGRVSGYLRFRRGDGSTFETEAASSVYQDDQGRRATCIVFRDITRRLEAQEKILQLNAQLEERVRQRTRELEKSNAELQAFSYSVSHDLRAPVATIHAFSQYLAEQSMVTDPKGRHYLERIIAGASRMDALIEGLLALAQINRADLAVKPLDISALAAEAVQDCRDGDPGRTVGVTIQEGLTAYGDRRLVAALLSNLVRNAWKFTRNRDDAAIVIESPGKEPDGTVIVCVRDNGVGFDEAYASHLFEAFQRLHREDEFPGLGIGLATAQRIVNRHGGRIWAKSQPGKGAAFSFTLAPGPSA